MKFGTPDFPHLLSLVSSLLAGMWFMEPIRMGWVGRDLSKTIWSNPPPWAGTSLFRPLFQALTVATADPETGTCSMAQTHSNFPRKSCPLTVGQQSFASFKTFATYKWAWKGIGWEMCFRMPCWICKHGLELQSINTRVQWKARVPLIVCRTQ